MASNIKQRIEANLEVAKSLYDQKQYNEALKSYKESLVNCEELVVKMNS
ncbi:MAG: hypothetical protein MRQ13_05490 [Candidatus Midichloria sp.]|nr:hypothetical protein [Candidatus Midichloria sp.]